MRIFGKITGILLLFIGVFVFTFPARAKGGDKEWIEFKEKVYNFGNIREDGGPVRCSFDFDNTGDGSLVIISATAECGCTTPDYPKNPIAPGKKGKITVTYNPLGRPGGFDKVVTVKARTMGKSKSKTEKIRLKIRGTVIPKK